jgi:hypothetical protein
MMLIRLINNHFNITYKGFDLIFQKRQSYGCFINLRQAMSLLLYCIADKPTPLIFLTNKVI